MVVGGLRPELICMWDIKGKKKKQSRLHIFTDISR